MDVLHHPHELGILSLYSWLGLSLSLHLLHLSLWHAPPLHTETDATVTDANVTNVGSDDDVVPSCSWVNIAEEILPEDFDISSSSQSHAEKTDDDVEIIEICQCTSQEFQMSSRNLLQQEITCAENFVTEDIPYWAMWRSIMSSFDVCLDNDQFYTLAHDIKWKLQLMMSRKYAYFDNKTDRVDRVAQSEIPLDGPTFLTAVFTQGDGNCLCQALSKSFFNTDEFHEEIRVRIIIEGILNKDKDLSDSCLERGATFIHGNADLPTVFATFSEFYTPGQKLTKDTVEAIYCMELQNCAKQNSYMGLWQLAQAASVFGVPIHTIYPVRVECSIRNDFHRMFFLVEYPATNDDEPIVIMWTWVRPGTALVHFVPLLKSIQ